MLQRWLATAGLLALFFLRIVLAQGVSFLFSFILFPSSSKGHFHASFSGTLVSFRSWAVNFSYTNALFILSLLCVAFLSS